MNRRRISHIGPPARRPKRVWKAWRVASLILLILLWGMYPAVSLSQDAGLPEETSGQDSPADTSQPDNGSTEEAQADGGETDGSDQAGGGDPTDGSDPTGGGSTGDTPSETPPPDDAGGTDSPSLTLEEALQQIIEHIGAIDGLSDEQKAELSEKISEKVQEAYAGFPGPEQTLDTVLVEAINGVILALISDMGPDEFSSEMIADVVEALCEAAIGGVAADRIAALADLAAEGAFHPRDFEHVLEVLTEAGRDEDDGSGELASGAAWVLKRVINLAGAQGLKPEVFKQTAKVIVQALESGMTPEEVWAAIEAGVASGMPLQKAVEFVKKQVKETEKQTGRKDQDGDHEQDKPGQSGKGKGPDGSENGDKHRNGADDDDDNDDDDDDVYETGDSDHDGDTGKDKDGRGGKGGGDSAGAKSGNSKGSR